MIRIVFTIAFVSLIAGLGCAGPAQQSDESPTSAEPSAQEPVAVGAHAVAQRFAERIDDKIDAEVAASVGSWSAARVARVWAAGDEYRAVIVRNNAAEKAPAVLLFVARDQHGAWQVVGQEPTTSTHLWPRL